MGWNGLKRNTLDYIITDLLPVELSELFSFRPFYEFLMKKNSQEILSEMIETTKKAKAAGSELFNSSWATKPMKFSILKGIDSTREMSLVQPLSALNVLIFMECYQKDVLNFFEKKRCFSLRYHKKETGLYYKARTKRGTDYFRRQSKRAGVNAVQQTGNFFNIAPFESINSFADSRIWRMSNFHFGYYAMMDYKACFDSIYTHAYKWIIERNVIDSKDAKSNPNLFVAIDRILMNINGLSSNGLIVGPEFSRMIAEVLLQQIDSEVYLSLFADGLHKDSDYSVFRYVDDIFVFAKAPETLDIVINRFQMIGEKYLLRLNEMKMVKGETPCVPKNWLASTRSLSDEIEGFFHNIRKVDYDKLPDDEKYIVRSEFIKVDRLKDEITAVMKEHPSDRRTIVSFLLSTLLNNVGKRKQGYTLFERNKTGKSFLLVDFALFIYSFCPSYDQTRKIISMIVYMSDEIDFKDSENKRKLKNVIDRYSFAFRRGNIFDLCDWLPFMREYNISFDVKTEIAMLQKAEQAMNPIIWANMMMYSSYCSDYSETIRKRVEDVIDEQLLRISDKNVMLHEEFWFVLIFHNCPHLSSAVAQKITGVIDSLHRKLNTNTNLRPSEKGVKLVCEFLYRKNSSNVKPTDSFFNWSSTKGIGAMITYRTFQRTIFKRYQRSKYSLYVSLS